MRTLKESIVGINKKPIRIGSRIPTFSELKPCDKIYIISIGDGWAETIQEFVITNIDSSGCIKFFKAYKKPMIIGVSSKNADAVKLVDCIAATSLESMVNYLENHGIKYNKDLYLIYDMVGECVGTKALNV